ncbi:MAG TPA: hypothetical protein VM093_00340 [Aeromicrobium sp.]|nr:hypothetical protein [Aeromicrobium sp.]
MAPHRLLRHRDRGVEVGAVEIVGEQAIAQPPDAVVEVLGRGADGCRNHLGLAVEDLAGTAVGDGIGERLQMPLRQPTLSSGVPNLVHGPRHRHSANLRTRHRGILLDLSPRPHRHRRGTLQLVRPGRVHLGQALGLCHRDGLLRHVQRPDLVAQRCGRGLQGACGGAHRVHHLVGPRNHESMILEHTDEKPVQTPQIR